MPASKIFYIVIAAGIVFIAIGTASSIYSNIPVDVPLDNIVRPGIVDVITPDMNVGSTANISVSGAAFQVEIEDPDGEVIESLTNISSFSYELTAQKAGQHRISINNTGTSDIVIEGHAQTKSSPLGVSGSLMLVVTGVITIGLGLRLRRH
jgi:hypothetical protein